MISNQVQYSQNIWEITELLRSSETLQEALTSSLRTIAKAVDAEAGSIWFHNTNDNRIYPVFVLGESDLSGLSLEYGEGLAGNVIATGTAAIVQDCDKDEHFAKRFDASTGFHTRSMICVPLINRFETIGCVQLLNRTDGHLFTDADVALCKTMAQLSAIVINDIGLLNEFLPKKKILISLKNVAKTDSDNNAPILQNIQLDIYENELLVLLSERGNQKNALLDILGGIDNPTSGTVTVRETDYSEADEATLTQYRRNDIGYVFPAPHLIPTLTVKENLDFIAELSDEPMDTEMALRIVKLSEEGTTYPAKLKPEQQQRLSIARALVKNPKLVIADEPTDTLDFEGSLQVLRALEKVAARGTTVILATHNKEIAKMANRIVKLKDGSVSEISVNTHPLAVNELQW